LRVSELCLGAMTFGEEWGFGASRDESRRIFDTFAEAGGNFIDTANKYTEGTSERFVGEFVGADRGRFVIATKYTLSMDPEDVNACGNHRKNMVQSLEASLKRLGTEYVDLLWVHAWDSLTPVDEIMRGLDDLVRAGKVFYVGISDTPAWRVAQANTVADLRGWSPFVALQVRYSLLDRAVERDLLPMARAFDLAVTCWGALGGGVLTGKYAGGAGAADTTRAEMNADHLTERNLNIAAEVRAVAKECGKTPSQVALAWVRAQRERAQVLPILGARTLAQLRDNLGCLDCRLTEEQLGRLDRKSAIELGFPHDFLASEGTRPFIYGNTWDRIDRPRR